MQAERQDPFAPPPLQLLKLYLKEKPFFKHKHEIQSFQICLSYINSSTIHQTPWIHNSKRAEQNYIHTKECKRWNHSVPGSVGKDPSAPSLYNLQTTDYTSQKNGKKEVRIIDIYNILAELMRGSMGTVTVIIFLESPLLLLVVVTHVRCSWCQLSLVLEQDNSSMNIYICIYVC